MLFILFKPTIVELFIAGKLQIRYNKHTNIVERSSVSPDGIVENPMLLKSLEWSADNEALRVIKNSPQWLPAIKNAKPITVTNIQTITFSVDY